MPLMKTTIRATFRTIHDSTMKRRNGELVEVLYPLNYEDTGPMFSVRFLSDNWVGEAFEDELHDQVTLTSLDHPVTLTNDPQRPFRRDDQEESK